MGQDAPEDRVALTHQVVEVIDGKTLTLNDGQSIRLAGVDAPNLAWDADEEPDPLAEEAKAALEQLAKGQSVRFALTEDELDRKGRLVGVVYTASGTSLQQAMLERGMAWVVTFPDSRELAAEFLQYERDARAAGRGVWGNPAYSIIQDYEADAYLGAFKIIEGRVTGVTYLRRNYYVNFGDDWKTDFTLMVAPKDEKRFKAAWIEGLAGKRVRVRGWLYNHNGPAIAFTHPEQLEVLDGAASTAE